ncbi:MAG: helix-turn-helix domain-containing protein [Candidatus Zixiibacteriota bacterium]
METLGHRVKKLRIKNNLSQRRLAKMVHTSPGLISFIERDRNRPNYEIIARIANKLSTSTDYLIFGEKRQASQTDISKLAIREQELIEKHDLLNRMSNLSHVDQKIILQILSRMERKAKMRISY